MMFRQIYYIEKNAVQLLNVKGLFKQQKFTYSDSFFTNNKTISEFYRGKSVVIAGGSGFVGKVTIAKLLKSCSSLDRIYLLVRDKNGKNIRERVQDMLNLPIFSEIKEDILAKVVPIESHYTKPGLGLDNKDRSEIVANGNILINLSAYTRFDQSLKTAVEVNVKPIREIIKLANEMKKLEALCHVSTAYSQAHFPENKMIMEDVYKPDYDYDKLITEVGSRKTKHTIKETKSILDTHPNQYTFSKSLAEYLISQEGCHLPLSIIRPSTVTPTLSEPTAAWTDKEQYFYSITSLVASGILRVIRYRECNQDFVPCDMVANQIIALTYYSAMRNIQYPIISNCTSGADNPTSMTEFIKTVSKTYRENYLPTVYRKPYCIITNNRLVANTIHYADQLIPGALVDLYSYAIGKKPRMLKTYSAFRKGENAFRYIISNGWKFEKTSQTMMMKNMTDNDIKEFNFDWKTIDWGKYYEKIALSLVKHDKSTVEKIKALQKQSEPHLKANV